MATIPFKTYGASKVNDGEVFAMDDGEVVGMDVEGLISAAVAGLATETSVSDVADDLADHEGDTGNPHAVTKNQVGLGNVDNTADLDKPISTATQTALDGKVATADLPGEAGPEDLLTTADIDGSGERGVQSTIYESDWIELAPSNGWTLIADGFLRCKRIGSTVWCEADGLNGSAATSNVVTSLPIGFRPSPPAPFPSGAGVLLTVYDGLNNAAVLRTGHLSDGGVLRIVRQEVTDGAFHFPFFTYQSPPT